MTWLLGLPALWGGLSSQAKTRALVGAVVLLAALAILLLLRSHDRSIIKAHDASENSVIIAKVTPANDKAADQRATDAITINTHEKEAHDAIHSVPDAAPAPPSIRLACQRLRRQGTDTSKLSACQRP